MVAVSDLAVNFRFPAYASPKLWQELASAIATLPSAARKHRLINTNFGSLVPIL
jgi:hypothetical protein